METIALFKSPPPPQEAGIYRALTRLPRLPLAQRSNFWALTANSYEPLWRGRSLYLLTAGSYSTARELALMLEWLQPQPGQAVLDAACSTGLYSRTLLGRVPDLSVHALDMSLPMLKEAQRRAEAAGLSPTLVQADVTELPYADAVFDAVVCGGSLNEFLDVPTALAEFSRVLKAGGKLFLMYLSRAETRGGRGLQGLVRLSGLRFIDPRALERQAAEAELGLLRAQYRGRVALALFAAG
ncbi:MAG: class I SAM-dependent methyltransferase [Deinococcota bacterium]|jgi:SAM-dependent methyltransferase|nr:class I SAM-dependent methyltransferase [Deinococcota bacterium]